MDGECINLTGICYTLEDDSRNTFITFNDDIEDTYDNFEFVKRALIHMLSGSNKRDVDVEEILESICDEYKHIVVEMVADDDHNLMSDSMDKLEKNDTDSYNEMILDSLSGSNIDTKTILDSLPLEEIISYARKKKLENAF
jgi:hypothetical protein